MGARVERLDVGNQGDHQIVIGIVDEDRADSADCAGVVDVGASTGVGGDPPAQRLAEAARARRPTLDELHHRTDPHLVHLRHSRVFKQHAGIDRHTQPREIAGRREHPPSRPERRKILKRGVYPVPLVVPRVAPAPPRHDPRLDVERGARHPRRLPDPRLHVDLEVEARYRLDHRLQKIEPRGRIGPELTRREQLALGAVGDDRLDEAVDRSTRQGVGISQTRRVRQQMPNRHGVNVLGQCGQMFPYPVVQTQRLLLDELQSRHRRHCLRNRRDVVDRHAGRGRLILQFGPADAAREDDLAVDRDCRCDARRPGRTTNLAQRIEDGALIGDGLRGSGGRHRQARGGNSAPPEIGGQRKDHGADPTARGPVRGTSARSRPRGCASRTVRYWPGRPRPGRGPGS